MGFLVVILMIMGLTGRGDIRVWCCFYFYLGESHATYLLVQASDPIFVPPFSFNLFQFAELVVMFMHLVLHRYLVFLLFSLFPPSFSVGLQLPKACKCNLMDGEPMNSMRFALVWDLYI
jgi:hypothetical protein